MSRRPTASDLQPRVEVFFMKVPQMVPTTVKRMKYLNSCDESKKLRLPIKLNEIHWVDASKTLLKVVEIFHFNTVGLFAIFSMGATDSSGAPRR